MIDLNSLNENQLRAVEWGKGPLLVLAGPGSGKTRVLTYRVARLIDSAPEQRFRVLGLTFTNKAASEMRDRITRLVPDADSRTLITTFHSFCADILRQHGHHLGLRPDFSILGQPADREAFLDEVIERVGAGDRYNADRLLPLVDRLLDRNLSGSLVEETLSRNRVENAPVIAAIYQRYRSSMLDQNRLDFGGLIAETIRLLEVKAAVCKQIRRVYPFVCVDEFQDTNESQYRVLRHVVDPQEKNLFVVADDDQIIYQWNGASPKRLEQLRSDFSMTLIQLPENYRCPPQVIELANKLIANNLGRSADKELLTAHKTPEQGCGVTLRGFESLDEETKWIAEDIAARPIEERRNCAVLARTRKVLEAVAKSLSDAGLTGALSLRKDEFTSPQLAWLHAMLRLANARHDREYLRRVCKAFYSLEGIFVDVRDVVSRSGTEGGDYFRAWQNLVLDREEIGTSTRTLIEAGVAELLNHLAFRGFVTQALSWFEQLDPSVDQKDEVFREELEVWNQLLGEISAQYGAENVSLHLLLQELDLRSKTPTLPPDSIPCFTIHASKGMEFGHVYLAALVEDQLPSWSAIKKGDDSHELQEERRNCFVAITRAEESLTLTYSQEVFGWSKDPSRFLYEMELLEEGKHS